MIYKVLIILFTGILCVYKCETEEGQVSIDSLYDKFSKQYCGRCTNNTDDSRCKFNNQNFNYKPETNFFTPKKVLSGLRNYEPISYVIFSVKGNYSFLRYGNLTNAEMSSIGYLPSRFFVKGVVLYYPSTIFGLRELPTNQGHLIQVLAALYTSFGYALLLPNYLKQRPYVLYPQQNVQSGMLALNEFKKYLDEKYPQMDKKYDLFAVGYSQGASYALWTQYCLTYFCQYQNVKLNQGYNFISSASMEGTYSLVNVALPFLQEPVSNTTDNKYNIKSQMLTNLVKPTLLVMMLNSFLTFNKNFGSLVNYLESDFYSMKCNKIFMKNDCNLGVSGMTIDYALKSNNASIEIIHAIGYSAFGKATYNTEYVVPFSEFISSNNSIFPLLKNSTILYHQIFQESMQLSEAIKFKPKQKAYIFSLKKDSYGSAKQAEQFRDKNLDNPKVKTYFYNNSEFIECKGIGTNEVDHYGAQLLGNIFVVAYLKNLTLPNRNDELRIG